MILYTRHTLLTNFVVILIVINGGTSDSITPSPPSIQPHHHHQYKHKLPSLDNNSHQDSSNNKSLIQTSKSSLQDGSYHQVVEQTLLHEDSKLKSNSDGGGGALAPTATDGTIIGVNAQTMEKHRNSDSVQHLGTKGGFTSDLEGAPCYTDTDCYLVNYNDTLDYKGGVVHAPYCQVQDNSSSVGYCTCGEYCVSRSRDSYDEHYFYYCGPCGRMGSTCSSSSPCNHSLSTCTSGYCNCDSGDYYDLYYCIIPYYGYEKALQVAIATCIFVAVCLLAATIYSSLYRGQQGRIHPYLLRLLLRRANQGTREAPPGDTPPKYDDVVDQPPSYQQALELEGGREGQDGEDNPAFDGDNKEDNNTNNNDGDGPNSIIKTEGSVPDDAPITVTTVTTKSCSNSDDGDSDSDDGDSDDGDEAYIRHVARDTGAVPKQRSFAKIKQMKRASQQMQKTAAGEETAADGGDGGGDGDDGDGGDVVSSSNCATAHQPITLPLRQDQTPA